MGIRFGFISTYPPTQCGLATFTASLLHALSSAGVDSARVARLVDSARTPAAAEVVGDIVVGDPDGGVRSVARLNDCDVVIVQHEFGIYGGADGQDVLAMLAALTIPSIVVLHTVLAEPTPHQRQVLQAVLDAASAVVVMSRTAHDRLVARHQIDPGKLSIIAHGAPERAGVAANLSPAFRSGQPTVLTWGLLGPGKGIEWGVEAMLRLQDLRPRPRYLVAGQTHPKVLLREGETYRASVRQLIERHCLSDSVMLDRRYRDARALAELVAAADVVLLPYDSTDQVTSGVLIEAVAAGKPVVATEFPHAVELLSGGAGVVVPHRNPAAIADALRMVLTRRQVAAAMSHAAEATAPQLRWPAVAQRYRELSGRLILDAALAVA
jgi:glycosyltransferase involved in cell wall biosynthesis